jgi:putative SOS response-associated peptidase YedK
MCGRYVIVTKIIEVEKRFQVEAEPGLIDFLPRFNLGPGSKGLVITDAQPDTLQSYIFGYTPFWSKKKLYIFNARAEGDKNKENDMTYAGAKEIFLKPMFRHSIRSKRCLIIADAFIEGPEKEKLSKPYLVYLRNKKRPFAFAGLWDEWADKSTGEVHHGYAIITTMPNEVTAAVGHHRSPVILDSSREKEWLSPDAELQDVLSMLDPYPASEMNAYPISADIKDPREEGKELIMPIGEPLFKETEIQLYEELRLEGMGMTTGRRGRLDQN